MAGIKCMTGTTLPEGCTLGRCAMIAQNVSPSGATMNLANAISKDAAGVSVPNVPMNGSKDIFRS